VILVVISEALRLEFTVFLVV